MNYINFKVPFLLFTGKPILPTFKYAVYLLYYLFLPYGLMARKGPEVGKGMLDFEEDVFVGIKSH